jgi:hypothetical protein
MLTTGILDLRTRALHDMSANKVPNSSGQATRTEIIQANRETMSGVQAFLVEQFPDSVVGSHFHSEYQFQLFVAGEGNIGRHELKPLTVHYASRYTGYGPIRASAAGVSYLTLRLRPDLAAPYWLPDSKQLLKAATRLNLTSPQAAVANRHERISRSTSSCEVMIQPRADGAAAWLLRLPPGQPAKLPEHERSGGRFIVVAAGGTSQDGAELPTLGCVFIPHGEPEPEVLADAEGADLLVLQFPEEALVPYSA